MKITIKITPKGAFTNYQKEETFCYAVDNDHDIRSAKDACERFVFDIMVKYMQARPINKTPSPSDTDVFQTALSLIEERLEDHLTNDGGIIILDRGIYETGTSAASIVILTESSTEIRTAPRDTTKFTEEMKRIKDFCPKKYRYAEAITLMCRELRDLGYNDAVEIFETMEK